MDTSPARSESSPAPRHTQVACADCDLLHSVPALSPGDQFFCSRCKHLITSRPYGGPQHALAYSLAALVCLVITHLYPFLSFEARGRSQMMTLWQTAIELYDHGYPVLAALVISFILLVPAAVLLMLVMLSVPMLLDKPPPPYARAFGRWLFVLAPWNMVEVFIIGILASLTKILTLATVIFGSAFWAYIAFGIFLTAALSQFDRYRFWQQFEVPESHQ